MFCSLGGIFPVRYDNGSPWQVEIKGQESAIQFTIWGILRI
jgi:hypothetical protein